MSIRVLGVFTNEKTHPDPLVANMYTAEGVDSGVIYTTQVFAARPADAFRHAVNNRDSLPWKVKVTS